ncbi:TonB-dependent siderophore receptor, partial [Aliarcobacter vitoriensis]|uniref:TonB-dependent siderophore receptor n=1 Tax=Aliarcobacter vitoriensis TaxID=2011099 RepID=UPI00211D90FD
KPKYQNFGNTTVLDEISVSSSNYKNGSAESGYLVEETSDIGPWKGKSLQDTPVSINVITEDLIQNIQATTVDQIYNINPTVSSHTIKEASAWNPIILRGVSGSAGTAFDGMKRVESFESNNPEEFERIETITGLSGFLYGANNVGGIINYIPKRPTSKAQHSVTIGNGGGTSGYYAHLDSGGPLDSEGKFGYRLNVVSEDHNTIVSNQDYDRQMINLALDYRPTDNLLLQATVSDSKYKLNGAQTSWSIGTGAKRSSAKLIDSNKLWGEKWAYYSKENRRYSTNLLWNINDNIDFRAAYMYEKQDRGGNSYVWTTINSDGTYDKEAYHRENGQEFKNWGAYAFLYFDFDTASINHQLTFGVQTSEGKTTGNIMGPDNGYGATLTGLSFDSPTYIGDLPKRTVIGRGLHWQNKYQNLTIGDSIALNPQCDLILGASYVTLENVVSGYEKSELTPSVSLVYKPFENLSLYTSYMEALEQGGIAGETYNGYDVTNANEQMDPIMSNQIEVGAKLTLGNTLLTAALFQIDRAFQFYDESDITKPKYVQDGRNVYKGFEFTATGKLTDNLTALGGFTLLEASVKDNKSNPALEGKTPFNVSDKFAKLYLEYTPFDSINFAVNGGANYTGSFYGTNFETDKIDSYILYNIGARYTTNATPYPLTFRVNVNNLFDKEYWASSWNTGDRRSVYASVQMKF